MQHSLPRFSLLAVLIAGSVQAQDNVLLLIADDLGVENVGIYGEGPAPPNTPRLDALANSGVLFDNAWAYPVCSPTRAAMQTGRHPFRTSVGTFIMPGRYPVLELEEHVIPELVAATVTSAMIGKWHLGNEFNGFDLGPNLAGWSRYAGSTLGMFLHPVGYYNWRKVEDGAVWIEFEYATTVNVDDALEWIDEQTKPWYCTVSFNAPHAPYNPPPWDLHSVNLNGKDPTTEPLPFYKASIEALDTEIGRLLDSLDPAVLARTHIVFISDNGTPSDVTELPYAPSHAKGSLYEGGVRVPLIIAGPAVQQPGRCEAIVGATDVFATIGDMLGYDLRTEVPAEVPLDSVSMMPYLEDPAREPLREMVYTELFGTGAFMNGRAIRDQRYKLVRPIDGVNPPVDQFYDLETDPLEQDDLLAGTLTREQADRYGALSGEIARLHGEPSFVVYGKSCDGTAGTPVLSAATPPAIGTTFEMRLEPISAAAIAAVGWFGIADDRASGLPLPVLLDPYGMPGCELLTSSDVPVPMVIDQGAIRWNLPIPAITSLLREPFYVQFQIVDIGANAAGMHFSAGGAAIIGN